jgi:phage terminase Nu1 subunit (DNA packaging protein)
MGKHLPDASIPQVVDSTGLACLFGCTTKTVESLATRGIVVRVAHGRYHFAESVRNYIEHLREQAAGRVGEDEAVDVIKANADFKISQRRLNDIKIAQLEGKLISIDEIEALWGELIDATKSLFLTFPSRARFDLAAPHRRRPGSLEPAGAGDAQRNRTSGSAKIAGQGTSQGRFVDAVAPPPLPFSTRRPRSRQAKSILSAPTRLPLAASRRWIASITVFRKQQRVPTLPSGAHL